MTLLFTIVLAVVINMVFTRFEATKDIMYALVSLRTQTALGGGGMKQPEIHPWRRHNLVCNQTTVTELRQCF